MTTMTNTAPRLSVKKQVLAAFAAMILAVTLPQLVHLIGGATGHGSALGEMLLPMHLPVLLVGFLAGPWAGAATGFLAPLVSFLGTGMPGSAMLPFMMIELWVYGLAGGLLCNTRMPAVLKVLLAQIAGRAVRAAAILVAFHGLGHTAVPTAVILTSIQVGVIGIALQLLLIPMVMTWTKRAGR